ncbi:Zinc finger, FYVE-related [Phytophthora cactorum]|nr:Zinc finger, FYVE-related [Phytophthora cactorum]
MLHAHSTISPVLTRQCQVVTGGEMQVRVLELMSLLCAPTERESNALLRALYGSRFIYSSLLHMISSSERGSLSPIATFTTGQQLTVRTVSFVRNGLVNPLKRRPPSAPDSRILMHEHGHSGAKNEQCCYIELLTPTQEGFTLVFCSLDAAEAAFTGNLPGGCDFQVAHNRLLFFAKRVCRLEKVVRSQQRQRDTLPGRLWHVLQKPFRAVGVSDDENSGGKHHNWHCIACTRSFLPTLSKRWRRCGLCGYRICASCCSNERVAVYNRYMVALLVCTRCRECIDERDSGIRRGMSGDTRYTGVTLHYRAGR